MLKIKMAPHGAIFPGAFAAPATGFRRSAQSVFGTTQDSPGNNP